VETESYDGVLGIGEIDEAVDRKLCKFRVLRLKPSWQGNLNALMLNRLPTAFKLRILHKTRHTTIDEVAVRSDCGN